MSTTKHTPGPWRVHGELINSDSREIAVIENYSSKRDGANARLIAAAPELLEALIEATEVLRRFGGIPGDPFKYDKIILKATGGAE